MGISFLEESRTFLTEALKCDRAGPGRAAGSSGVTELPRGHRDPSPRVWLGMLRACELGQPHSCCRSSSTDGLTALDEPPSTAPDPLNHVQPHLLLRFLPSRESHGNKKG